MYLHYPQANPVGYICRNPSRGRYSREASRDVSHNAFIKRGVRPHRPSGKFKTLHLFQSHFCVFCAFIPNAKHRSEYSRS